MVIKIVPGKNQTYYYNGLDEKDPQFVDAKVVFENHKWFGWGWNLYVRNYVRGYIRQLDLISKSHLKSQKEGKLTPEEIFEYRKEVENAAMLWMTKRDFHGEWCRGFPPNF